MESCLCSICLNIHVMYNIFHTNVQKEFPDSLTSYLTANIQCNKDEDADFPKLECITGECKNSCAISNEDTSDMSMIKWVSTMSLKM